MYMKNNQKFIEMMNGGYGRFNLNEMWTIMTNLNVLHINTIYTQQLVDGTFVCTVDKPTVDYYKKECMDNV